MGSHHPIPRREPDPPMPPRLAFAYWALGFVGTLTAISVIPWIVERIA